VRLRPRFHEPTFGAVRSFEQEQARENRDGGRIGGKGAVAERVVEIFARPAALDSGSLMASAQIEVPFSVVFERFPFSFFPILPVDLSCGASTACVFLRRKAG
jgi:hypothetical protein